MTDLSRRKFVKQLGSATALCCMGGAMAVLGTSCTPVFYATTVQEGNKLLIKKFEVLDKPFFVVKIKDANAPLYVIKRENGSYDGIVMLCTHKRCELKATGTYLTCPCHGSEFSNEGKVLKGPAKNNLKHYKVTSNEENIIILLR
ncbi:MAG: Rieske (2Fe-2S) protein [Flavobacteriales bacterium]|nr:Rieske (2Fe-2S) protein [Flavobacteriales bacterium]